MTTIDGCSPTRSMTLGALALPGDLAVPVDARGLVMFVHGSGSSRPDLALAHLGAVRAPTLLIVGGDDWQVLDLNRKALAALRCPKQLQVVPGATHLFEEPGTLEAAARLAGDWFADHLAPSAAAPRTSP